MQENNNLKNAVEQIITKKSWIVHQMGKVTQIICPLISHLPLLNGNSFVKSSKIPESKSKEAKPDKRVFFSALCARFQQACK